MADLHRCPTCGNPLSDTLAGQCPACLLKGGMAASPAAASGPETAPYQSQPGEPTDSATSVLPNPGEDFGAYHIVRALGKGGMGAVFEAEEHDTGRRLALKVLKHSLSSSSARHRFLREGQLAAQLNHPQSVYVFGTGEIQGAPVIMMELVHGGTLQDRIRKHGPMPIQEAVDAVLQVIDGLEAAQAVGVLHRDVKPANCFIDRDGKVKIGDFGLSISKEARGDLHLTISGVFLGTPTFASPEQLRGDELDARSDQYAVGITLFYLLTGQVPFEAASMVQLVAKVLEKPAPDVRSLRPEVPRELALVLQGCLAKEPGQRYRTYADLRTALLPFGSASPSPAPLSRRFIAGCIDYGVLLGFQVGLMGILALYGINLFMAGTEAVWTDHLLKVALAFSWYLAYYIIPEGLVGASLGKKLLGMRVVREGRREPPGLWRATVRTLIFEWLPGVPFFLLLLAQPSLIDTDGEVHSGGVAIALLGAATVGTYFFFGLLFATMRRSNGYAGLHDLAAGTRVVVRPTALHRPKSLVPQETPDEPQAATTTIGPYHVLAHLGTNGAGDWLLGYDPRLFRKVWLCVVPAGTPAVAAPRQNVGRPGRLRWLAGRRGPQENWDAFEAPTGQALWQLLDQPQDWRHAGFWLLDLSEELAAALKDDTLPETLGLERVWITADGRAMLLDSEAPGLQGPSVASIATQPGEVGPVRGFLHQVAVATLHGRRMGYEEAQADTFALPLPLYVRTVVEGLKKVQRPEVAAAQIQSVLGKPTRVSKLRRAGLLACCVGIPLILILPFAVFMFFYASDLNAPPELVDLQKALNWYAPKDNRFEATDYQKKAIEIYLAGTQRERINNAETWNDPYLVIHVRLRQREAAEEIIARTPPPTEEELKEAMTIVSPGLKAMEDHSKPEFTMALLLTFIFAVCTLAYVAIPSVLAALLFRGGLLWRLFSITAVTKDGQQVGRWRLAWRNFIAWSPLLIAPFAWALLMPLGIELTVPLICLAIAYASLALASTFAKRRGLPDWLAGTWLVIR